VTTLIASVYCTYFPAQPDIPKGYVPKYHKMPIPTEPTLSLINVIIGITTVVIGILALIVEFGSYVEVRKRGKS
jgi:hypothetical protein